MLKAFLYLWLGGTLIYMAITLGPEIMHNHCLHKWQESGFQSRFEFGKGCLVEIDGRWIPEANVQIGPKTR